MLASSMTAIIAPATAPTIEVAKSPIFQPAMTTSCRPDRSSVQRVASKALQTRKVTVDNLGDGIFRTFRLQPTSDYFYVLICQPSPHLRLLSNESNRLQTEALVLHVLRGKLDVSWPRVIEYSDKPCSIGCSYLISGPFKGSILSDIVPSLSRQTLGSIDRSLGQYISMLSQVTGPSFGPVRRTNPPSGSMSWSRCYASLLESILRDGEDALINLPYDFIRDQVRRHQKELDQITQPMLVLLEVSSDNNLLVDPISHRLSGLLDHSTAIWGDPYMSDCFYKPSVEFLEGFGKMPNRTADERIRQHLYTLYHSLLGVVRQCYRPYEAGDEMSARRSLTTALAQLSAATRS